MPFYEPMVILLGIGVRGGKRYSVDEVKILIDYCFQKMSDREGGMEGEGEITHEETCLNEWIRFYAIDF